MVIAFDSLALSSRFRYHGSYVYAKNLLEEFAKLAQVESTLTFKVFTTSDNANDAKYIGSTSRLQVIESPWLRFHRFWRLGGAWMAARSERADLFFSPTPQILPLGGFPLVVTIHDAIQARLPASMVYRSPALRFFCRLAAKRAEQILTDSENSKTDLVEIYGARPEKVKVIYLGFDRERYNHLPPDPVGLRKVREQHGIARPYILHAGRIEPRKNLLRLVKAYALLAGRHADLEFDLVLAGSRGWNHEPTVQAADQVKSPGKVILTGSLSDDDLAVLVKGATLCVLPSLYEGFCLPLVEAMACGRPTVASKTSCLPEISGNVLLYFDPESVEDIAEKVWLALGDEEIRKRLSLDGLQRANFFSWERCARETLDVLKQVCQGRGKVEGLK